MLSRLRELTLSCTVCDSRMEQFCTIPAAASLPELKRFRCRSCGSYKTVEGPSLSADERAS